MEGGAIKREDAGIIARGLKETQRHLQKGNIFSCLVCFKGTLEKMLQIKMIPSDEKELNQEINAFQSTLSASKTFRDIYGPVTFRDNDIATALDFMRQLIEIKEEEAMALLAAEDEKDTAENSPDTVLIRDVKALIEKGDHTAAQDLLADHEELSSHLVSAYNETGIEHRRAERFDEAVKAFKKALVVQPNDEGLYYNLARALIGKNEWKEAAEAIGKGLQINPDFTEGIKLLKYIRGKDWE